MSKKEAALKSSEENDDKQASDPTDLEDDIVDAEALMMPQLPTVASEGQCNKTLADKRAQLAKDRAKVRAEIAGAASSSAPQYDQAFTLQFKKARDRRTTAEAVLYLPEGGLGWIEQTPLGFGGMSELPMPNSFVKVSRIQAEIARNTMQICKQLTNESSGNHRAQKGEDVTFAILNEIVSASVNDNHMSQHHEGCGNQCFNSYSTLCVAACQWLVLAVMRRQ